MRARQTASEITAFCDFDRTLGADDMKVTLDATRQVAEMAKTLPTWDCGYVGMTYVPAARRDDYFAAAAQRPRDEGRASHVESILVALAERGQPRASPTSAVMAGSRSTSRTSARTRTRSSRASAGGPES